MVTQLFSHVSEWEKVFLGPMASHDGHGNCNTMVWPLCQIHFLGAWFEVDKLGTRGSRGNKTSLLGNRTHLREKNDSGFWFSWATFDYSFKSVVFVIIFCAIETVLSICLPFPSSCSNTILPNAHLKTSVFVSCHETAVAPLLFFFGWWRPVCALPQWL